MKTVSLFFKVSHTFKLTCFRIIPNQFSKKHSHPFIFINTCSRLAASFPELTWAMLKSTTTDKLATLHPSRAGNNRRTDHFLRDCQTIYNCTRITADKQSRKWALAPGKTKHRPNILQNGGPFRTAVGAIGERTDGSLENFK